MQHYLPHEKKSLPHNNYVLVNTTPNNPQYPTMPHEQTRSNYEFITPNTKFSSHSYAGAIARTHTLLVRNTRWKHRNVGHMYHKSSQQPELGTRTQRQKVIQSHVYVHQNTLNNTGSQTRYTKGCYNCGEHNHRQVNCRFDYQLKCFSCNYLGHKQKNCRVSNNY